LWTFLLADVQFTILGVDFLCHHHLLVDPAANRLVASTSASPQLSSSPSSPASAVANVKEPSGSLATVLQAGIGCSSPSASVSAVANVKAPSGSLATVLKAGQQSSSSDPVTAGSVCSTSSTWCQQFLSEFVDVVNPSKQLPILPETIDVLHHIKTSGPPISSKFRRLDGEKLAAAKAEFAQLEKEGIVRCSDSPWSSALHMVEKADGMWRPCGDFRRLNLVTEPDSCLLPNMMDFAQKVAVCSVFSKIDLRKGYHQIPMNPADICNCHHYSFWVI
jgi:hypothetical protein